jgi:hypothetical protein
MAQMAAPSRVVVQFLLPHFLAMLSIQSFIWCRPLLWFHTCSREYQSSLLERQQFLDLLKQNFARAQNKMKVAIDTKRSAHNFQLGEMVLLKLQPYAQSPVVNMPNYLLSKPSMSHNQVSVCIPLEII